MKKTGIVLLFLAGAVLAAAQTAVIRDVTGTVEIKAPGTAEWKRAAAGQELDRETLVSTGFRSTAYIAVGNSTVMVRPLTRLSLEEIAAGQGSEEVTLSLRAGRIRAEVVPPAGKKVKFSVRAPIATASVRGTVFEFDGIRLNVEEGRVHLSGDSITGAYIGAGHSTAVDTETGKTVPAAERVKEELAPALPAGVDSSPSSGTSTAVPVIGGLDVGFDWLEE
jgi:hypothetical protein